MLALEDLNHAQSVYTARHSVIDVMARPGEPMYEVATAALAEPPETPLTPTEVFDLILPSHGAGGPARYELLERADARIAAAAADHAATSPYSFNLRLTTLGMRRVLHEEEYHPSNYAMDSIFVVPGGANRTSIVRRHVATQAMRAINVNGPMYQFGSNKVVPPVRTDGSANPEHNLLRSLAPDFLPEDAFTQFDANLATAQQQGYEIMADTKNADQLPATSPTPIFRRAIILHHPDAEAFPDLSLIEPFEPTFEGGLDAVRSFEEFLDRPLAGRRILVATNGQYRPVAELQALEWADAAGVEMRLPHAFGDEPGDTMPYQGRTFTTAERSPLTYFQEMAALGRRLSSPLIQQLLATA